MISPERFYQQLSTNGVNFFTGVPDSSLRHFLYYLYDNIEPANHCIAANEAHAVALATGYHLSTGEVPLVYMQNSGLGNAINPLTSLTDPQIYSIPMLLLIGWRGMPGRSDEPQHKKMGSITKDLLGVLEVPVFILDSNEEKSLEMISMAAKECIIRQQPVAIMVPGEIFESHSQPETDNPYKLSREYVIEQLLSYLEGDEMVVSTTGKTSRELDELNNRMGKRIKNQFLSVGSMGLANHVALGISMQYSGRVIMLDGDGSLLMHMGTMALIGTTAPTSFVHILINNGCHESVGGHATAGFSINFTDIAKACGYSLVCLIKNKEELHEWVKNSFPAKQKQFVEIRVNSKSRSDLGRPVGLPVDWKKELMKNISAKESRKR